MASISRQMTNPPQSEKSHTEKLVALVGNPNTGKTTLFNALTGFRQRVGNYPGVTVEKKTGHLALGESKRSDVVIQDLPGAYSLSANSADEAVVLDVLLGSQADSRPPDAILVVLDATSMGRNLFLASQVLDLGKPVVVALTMVDLAESEGLDVDVSALSRELGCPAVPVVASKGVGLEQLGVAIQDVFSKVPENRCPSFPDCVCAEMDGLAKSVNESNPALSFSQSRTELLQTILDPGGYHEERLAQRCGKGLAEELAERRKRIEDSGESIVEVEARIRYAWVDRVREQVVSRTSPLRQPASEKVDRILTHRVFGLVIFAVMMGACFQSIYAWATPIMDAIDTGIEFLRVFVGGWLPDGAVRSLVVDGVISGVGAVLVFLPQILILFLFLAILEDCGYMSRAAFLLDRWMGMFGLNGKSFIPLLSSFACAVPGILATRTIEDRRDRFVTILIAPLMSCSARLPVYILLIGAFVPSTALLGGLINLQAAVLFGMYVLGVVVAIAMAAVLKRTTFRGQPRSFLMELPTYKMPSVKTVLYRMYEQGKAFCVTAGTIIFAVSIVIWALGYYPRSADVAKKYDGQRKDIDARLAEKFDGLAETTSILLTEGTIADNPSILSVLDAITEAETRFRESVRDGGLRQDSAEWTRAKRVAEDATQKAVASAGQFGNLGLQVYRLKQQANLDRREIDRTEAGTYLRQSFLGRMGRLIEPAVEPLGWDWRIGMAIIASFPAREVVIATLGTIYNLGADENENSTRLREKLHAAQWPDGKPVFNLAVALSIMVFFALCCQCGGTLAAIRRETNSWRWPIFTFVYMTGLAYVLAYATYHVADWLA